MTITAFLLYAAALALIGFIGYRQTGDFDDFVLGGRRLSAPVAAISAGASDMSGWLLLALPGLVLTGGYEAAWVALGLGLGTWLNWRLVAERLRAATAEAGAVTLPTFLAHRYPRHGDALRRLAGLAIVLFFTLYTAAGLVAGAKLFEHVLALPYGVSLIGGAVVVLGYTLVGGFFAVTLTDLVQGLLMLFALLIVPALALAFVADVGPRGIVLDWHHTTEPFGKVAMLSAASWGLGYFGQPHILARFMALESPRAATAARRIAVSWTALGLGAALAVGLVGSAPEFASAMGGDPERVFLALIEQTLPAALAGLCLAGVLAAIMSTADSQLLVAASAIAGDLAKDPAGDTTDEAARRRLQRGRLGVLAVLLVALALASDPDSRVIDLVAWAWAGFGATFGPLVLLTLHRRAFSEHAALVTLVVGLGTVIAWRWLPGRLGDVYELGPAFLFALVAGLLTDALSRRQTQAP